MILESFDLRMDEESIEKGYEENTKFMTIRVETKILSEEGLS